MARRCPVGPPKEMSDRPKQPEPALEQKLFRADALARFQRAVRAEIGFAERLVHFWSNHFCVSAAKGGPVRAIAGCFEREAIRPHVLGRFGDMLKAVDQPSGHAALSRQRPVVRPGLRSARRGTASAGLNENLAREILELHTLGVAGGYTQADVTALARILTGWTFAGPAGRLGEPGLFTSSPTLTSPATTRCSARSTAAGGIEQGEAALADLARHPATARHIATKLARHFVADEPPPAARRRGWQAVSRRRGGDLTALAARWSTRTRPGPAPPAKIRSPYEFLMAAVRAVARVRRKTRALLGPLGVMGMPLWQPPGPNGWPDTVAAWATPKGMKSRLDVAAAIAARLKETLHPTELLEATPARRLRARRGRRRTAEVAPAGPGAAADVPRVSMEIGR